MDNGKCYRSTTITFLGSSVFCSLPRVRNRVSVASATAPREKGFNFWKLASEEKRVH